MIRKVPPRSCVPHSQQWNGSQVCTGVGCGIMWVSVSACMVSSKSCPPVKKLAASFTCVLAGRWLAILMAGRLAAKHLRMLLPLLDVLGLGLQEVGKPTCRAAPSGLMGVLAVPFPVADRFRTADRAGWHGIGSARSAAAQVLCHSF